MVVIKKILMKTAFLLMIIILPILILSCFDFLIIKLNFNLIHLIKEFLLKEILSEAKLSVYTSLITFMALLIAILQWINAEGNNKKAIINGLIEELHHNISISSYNFMIYDEKEFYQSLYKEIKSFKKLLIYPNPSDNTEIQNELYGFIPTINELSEIQFPRYVFLKREFINSVINNNFFFNLKNKRIFLNIGHLDYSLKRYNFLLNKGRINSMDDYITIRKEYIRWVHFRLHFLLIDLITSVDADDVIDKEYYKKIINLISD